MPTLMSSRLGSSTKPFDFLVKKIANETVSNNIKLLAITEKSNKSMALPAMKITYFSPTQMMAQIKAKRMAGCFSISRSLSLGNLRWTWFVPCALS